MSTEATEMPLSEFRGPWTPRGADSKPGFRVTGTAAFVFGISNTVCDDLTAQSLRLIQRHFPAVMFPGKIL
jgi:hypothetical protein